MRKVLEALAVAILVVASVTFSQTAFGSQARIDGEFDVVMFGDSISLGPSYAPQLEALLAQAGVTSRLTTVAHGGWSCGMLQSLVPQVPTNTELVIIDCGTNDAFVPTIDGPYNSLLDALLAQAPQAVILPGWIQYTSYRFGGTGFQNAESLVNDSIYRVTMNSAKGPRVIWPPVDYQQIPEWYLSEDGIHPSPAGYDVKAILIYNRIRAKFGLPDVAQPLCGMVGDWRIPHVAYSPCSVTRAK